MTDSLRNALLGARAALPIAAAYLPVAVALGAAASRIGLSPGESALWSAIMFSGANQALMLSSLGTGMSITAIVILCVIASLRHVLYGLALRDRLPGSRKIRAVFAYGLTDEVFATVLASDTGRTGQWRSAWLIGLSMTALGVWVIGTGIGNAAGNLLQEGSAALRGALDFALPALFMALVWTTASKRMARPMVAAALIATGFLFMGRPELAVVAASAAAFIPARRSQP